MIESRYYLTPRAQFGTPISPTNVLARGLNSNHEDRQIMSPSERHPKAMMILQTPMSSERQQDQRLDSSILEIQSYQDSVDGYGSFKHRRDSSNTNNNPRKVPVVK